MKIAFWGLLAAFILPAASASASGISNHQSPVVSDIYIRSTVAAERCLARIFTSAEIMKIKELAAFSDSLDAFQARLNKARTDLGTANCHAPDVEIDTFFFQRVIDPELRQSEQKAKSEQSDESAPVAR